MTVGRKTVVLVDYDPQWPVAFRALAEVLAAKLGDLAECIEHVGSTAVPGLPAKPILDIDVVLPSLAQLPAAIEALAELGYFHQGDLGIAGREAFNRLGPDVPRDGMGRSWPVQNLYVCARDSRELERHLRFRDYLRQHPEAAAEYAALKRALAQAFRHDRDAYTEGKTAFVERILSRARTGPG